MNNKNKIEERKRKDTYCESFQHLTSPEKISSSILSTLHKTINYSCNFNYYYKQEREEEGDGRERRR